MLLSWDVGTQPDAWDLAPTRRDTWAHRPPAHYRSPNTETAGQENRRTVTKRRGQAGSQQPVVEVLCDLVC